MLAFSGQVEISSTESYRTVVPAEIRSDKRTDSVSSAGGIIATTLQILGQRAALGGRRVDFFPRCFVLFQ